MSSFKPAALAVAIFSTLSPPVQADDLPEVFVSAKRFEESAAAMPTGAMVLTAEQIDQSAATTIPEVLAKLAGAHVRNNAGSPNWQIDLRGFGISGEENTLILLDGQRLSEYELTPALVAGIPLSSVVRIEILPGSGSVLYGGGATGGTINIITEGARRNATRGRVNLSAGSYGSQSTQASLNIGNESTAFLLGASQSDTDNYRVHNKAGEKNVQGELRLFGQDGDVRLKFGSSREELQFPGVRTMAQLSSDPRGATTPFDKSTTDTSTLGLSGSYLTTLGELAIDISHRDKHARSNLVSSWAGAQTIDTRTDTWTVSPRFRLPHDLLGQGSELIVGIDHVDWDFNTNDSVNGKAKGKQQTDAFYVQENARLSATTRLNAGLRWQRAEDSFTLPKTQQRTNNLSAYEIRLSEALSQQVQVYAKLGKSFRVATVNENYDLFSGTVSFLRPQTSRDLELGTELYLSSARLRAAYFRSNLTDEIHYMVASPFFSNTNLSPTRREGIELDGKWQATEHLHFGGNYRYTRASFRSGNYGGVDVSGNEVPLVPRHLLTFNSAWAITRDDQLSASLSYVGQQRYDNDQINTFQRMPSYTLLDLKYRHTMGDWSVSGAIDNLTDKRYYSYAVRNGAGTSFNAYPELGRRLMATVEYRFR